MRYLGTNQPTGKNVYVYACKMLQNTLKKISSSGLSLGPSQRILVFFFSWKCVMKVHRHFLYHQKHNALFKKCFQLVDGMMTVNTNEHDLPSLRTGIRRVNQRYSSIDIHRSNWFHEEGPLSLIFPSQTYDVTHLWVNVKIERRDKLCWKSSTMINLKKIC